MPVAGYNDCWAALDRAEQLAGEGGDRALLEAAQIATRVRDEASRERAELQPSPWDDGAWARWTVLMTRASLLLVRLRKGGADSSRRSDPPRGATARSGVRMRTRSVDSTILVVEPDIRVREQLVMDARAVGVQLYVAAAIDEAAEVSARDRPRVVVCRFPLHGAVPFVEALRREERTVLIVTSEVLRAIATFGLEVPVLTAPASLIAILEQVHELGARRSRTSRAVGAISEVPPPPNPRDPRRE